jgi:hypothetical protein
MTAGLPLSLHRRYSLRPPPIAIFPVKSPRTGVAFARAASCAGAPDANAKMAAAIAMTTPLAAPGSNARSHHAGLEGVRRARRAFLAAEERGELAETV